MIDQARSAVGRSAPSGDEQKHERRERQAGDHHREENKHHSLVIPRPTAMKRQDVLPDRGTAVFAQQPARPDSGDAHGDLADGARALQSKTSISTRS